MKVDFRSYNRLNAVLVAMGILFLFAITSPVFAARPNLDSLQQAVPLMVNGQEKLDGLLLLADKLKKKDADKAVEFGQAAVMLARDLGDRRKLGHAHMFVAGAENVKANWDLTMTSVMKAIEILEKEEDNTMLAKSLRLLGNVNLQQGNRERALEMFNKSTHHFKLDHNLRGVASNLGNIGNIYLAAGELDKALENFFMALKQFQDLEDQGGIALCYGVIGNTYRKEENYKESTRYLKKSLEIFERRGDKYNQATTILNIGVNEKYMENWAEAERHFQRSLEISKELGAKVNIRKAYINLAAIHASQNSYKLAYEYYTQYSIIKDSIFTEKSAKQQAEMAEKYESAEKEKELVKAQAAQEIAEAQNEKTMRFAIFLSIGMVLVIGMVVMTLRNLAQKKRANALLEAQKAEIEEKNEHLTSANTEITMQKQEIEEKNKDITDSITYAKRLQDAILPPPKLTKKYMRDSFIVYKPKDIVSGDFYWTESRDGIVLFSAVDCTGHGVPGAMVSVVGHNGLTRSVKEFGLTKPAAVLDKLNFLVEETFGRDTDTSAIRDGMDLALCSIDWETLELNYSGANNPLYIIRKGEVGDTFEGIEANLAHEGYLLFEVKADKQPIGAYDNRKPFTNHQFQLQSGDSIYIFSDGYADQFGGDKGKKFKYRNFKLLLLSIQQSEMTEQHQVLQKTIDDWMADYEQVDDICVIGVRV